MVRKPRHAEARRKEYNEKNKQCAFNERERRAAEAAAVAAELETQYHTALLGTTQQVLFEQEENGLYAGHAMNYVKVYVQAAQLHNELRAVRVTDLCRDGVFGELE